MNTGTTTRLALAAAVISCVGAISLVSSEEYGPAKQAYDDYIDRPSLQMRTRGRDQLAATQHPGAFHILRESYARPEEPKDHVKYLLASICAKYFDADEFTDGWTEWREDHDKTEDAWLWYRSLIHHLENRGPDVLYAIADDERDLFLQAAALEALAEDPDDRLLAWWEKQLEDADGWKGIDRAVYLETAARTLMNAGRQHGEDQFRETALELIPHIEHRRTEHRTQVVMARCFREIFGGEKLFVNADPWIKRLLNPEDETAEEDDKYAPAVPPTEFVGVEANGKRIVYVIDMSDSMLIPLSKKDKEDLKKPKKPKGPVTGRGGEKDNEEEEEEEAEEDELPWDKINTRFDAAREYLKLSLRSLQDDQSFCVIWFGTGHETLRATNGLVPANKSNVERACSELDRISKGPATPDRTHGTLKGNTNLHGGIHHAYKLHARGTVKEWEYVQPDTFFTGADTIFVLSDGAPTWDDWPKVDKRDEWDQTGDPETNKKHPDQENLEFPGPYGYWRYSGQGEWITDDVRRLNLYRKCEIHCIGIGEASYSLLWQIARLGNGQVKMVGG